MPPRMRSTGNNVPQPTILHRYCCVFQERIDLAQKSSRRANMRPRSAGPLTRGGDQSSKQHATLTAVSTAGAKSSQQQRTDRMVKDDIDVPRPSARDRGEMATKERPGKNVTSSATGVGNGAGPQEVPPTVGRLKTPVLRRIEVGGGGARDSLYPKVFDFPKF